MKLDIHGAPFPSRSLREQVRLNISMVMLQERVDGCQVDIVLPSVRAEASGICLVGIELRAKGTDLVANAMRTGRDIITMCLGQGHEGRNEMGSDQGCVWFCWATGLLLTGSRRGAE